MRPEAIAAMPGRAALVVLALAILWRVIQVNAVLYDENGRQRLAVPATDAAMSVDERHVAAAVLRDNPAEIAALLVTARGFERDGRASEAARAYEAAYRLAPLDREVLRGASSFFERQGRTDEALAMMDRLVTHYPEMRATAFPVMAQSLAAGRNAETWKRILENDPAWAGAFVLSSCASGADPALVMPLFLARAARSAAKPDEITCVVDRLRRADRWDEAYQAWLNTLPRERLSEVGAVFNGSFEFAATGLGFDWVVSRRPERESGHTVEITRAIGVAGSRALKVSYNGKRQSGTPVAQYLVLAPGRYEISGLGRPEGLRVGHGIRWTLRCVSAGAAGPIVAQSERFTGSDEWRRFSFAADIPPSCAGQLLQLEPATTQESAAYIAGVAWFDDLAARRIP